MSAIFFLAAALVLPGPALSAGRAQAAFGGDTSSPEGSVGVSTSTSLTAREIVNRANKVMRGDSSRASFSMTIQTPDWTRTLEASAWNKGREKALVLVHAPAKDRGTGTLKLGREMWLWLPHVERVIKIPPGMMHNSWMGSDFTNEDVVKADSVVKDYTHSILSMRQEEGWDLYEVLAVPLPDAPVVWGKVLLWGRVYKDGRVIPIKEEDYSERGELIRTIELGDIELQDGQLVPTRLTCIPRRKPGQKTTLKYSHIKFNVSYPDNFFSLSRLERSQ